MAVGGASARTPESYSKVPADPSKSSGLHQRIGKSALDDTDSDNEDTSHLSERDQAKKKWVRRLNWVWRKVTAAFWVAAACGMIYWTNFFRVIWESPLVNRTYFYLALACLAFNITMLIYLALWCAWVKGIKDPWETHCPKAVPVMAVVGCTTAALFFFAFWRVWGLLTLVIQFLFFIGFISAGQFLPSGALGSIMMFVIFFGAFFTSEMIPHEGLAHYTPKAPVPVVR